MPWLLEATNSAGDFLCSAVGPDKKLYVSYRDASLHVLNVAIGTLYNTVDSNCRGY